ncbi:hypothetical protein PPN31114_00659 [Pandoraea pneumonica]|uniref:Uncharacterized protein n=1 Tax=Pandoraea pneumonica TaxID=2508299 RepID=A0A5E4S8S2_9BURK|nr:contractile injection system tape measure protein [Pandoraea pneumonica]VVD72000.1 hypothetical protein PPN31114_00659 [Pandoraea pneumonica]
MNTRHRIDHLAFDLTFTAGGLDMSQSDALRSLVVDRLLPVVSTVFDNRAPGEGVIRIDRLDIDLGSVPVADLPEALAESLSDALEQALAERGGDVPGHGAPVVTRFESAVDADTASLMGFLTSGRLPDRLAAVTDAGRAVRGDVRADEGQGRRQAARKRPWEESRQEVGQEVGQEVRQDAQADVEADTQGDTERDTRSDAQGETQRDTRSDAQDETQRAAYSDAEALSRSDRQSDAQGQTSPDRQSDAQGRTPPDRHSNAQRQTPDDAQFDEPSETQHDVQSAAQTHVSNAPLEALLARVLAGDVEPIRRLLLSSASRDVQIARLVRQFPEAQIEAMLYALRPAEAQRWLADLDAIDETLAVAGWTANAREAAQLVAREKLLAIGLTPLSAGGLQTPWHEIWQAVLIGERAGLGTQNTAKAGQDIATRAAQVLRQVELAQLAPAPLMLAVLRRLAGTSAHGRAAVMDRPISPGTAANVGDVNKVVNVDDMADVTNAADVVDLANVPNVPNGLPFAEIDIADGEGREVEIASERLVAKAASRDDSVPHKLTKEAEGEAGTEAWTRAADAKEEDRATAELATMGGNSVAQGDWRGANETLTETPYSAHLLARTRVLLANAFARGQSQALYDVWPQLMREAPTLVRDALRHYAAYPDLRDRMAMSLPVSLLEDMLALLAAQMPESQSEQAALTGWARRRAWSEAVAAAFSGTSAEIEGEEGSDGASPSMLVDEAWRHMSADAAVVAADGTPEPTNLATPHVSTAEAQLHDEVVRPGSTLETNPALVAHSGTVAASVPDESASPNDGESTPRVSHTGAAGEREQQKSESPAEAMPPSPDIADEAMMSAAAGRNPAAARPAQPIAGKPSDEQSAIEISVAPDPDNESAVAKVEAGATGGHVGERGRLIEALLSGESAPLYDDWADWLSTRGEMLTSAFRHYGRRDEVLTRIVAGFPENMLLDLATLLHPASAVYWRSLRALAREDALPERPVSVRGEPKADDIAANVPSHDSIAASALPSALPTNGTDLPSHASVDVWRRAIWKRVFEWLLQTSPVQPLTLDGMRGLASAERLAGWQLRLMQVWESNALGLATEQGDVRKPLIAPTGRSDSPNSAVTRDAFDDPTQHGISARDAVPDAESSSALEGGESLGERGASNESGTAVAKSEVSGGSQAVLVPRTTSASSSPAVSSKFAGSVEQRGPDSDIAPEQTGVAVGASDAVAAVDTVEAVDVADATETTDAVTAAHANDVGNASASDALQRLLQVHREMTSLGASLVSRTGGLSQEARATLQRDLGLSRAMLISGVGTLAPQAWAAVADIVVSVSEAIPAAHRESFYDAIVKHTPVASPEASLAVARYYASVVAALLEGSTLDLEALSETASMNRALDEDSVHATEHRDNAASPASSASTLSTKTDAQPDAPHHSADTASRPTPDQTSRRTSFPESTARQRPAQHRSQESGPDMASTQPTDFLDYVASSDFRNGRGTHPPGLSVWLHQAMQTGAAALRQVLTPAAIDDDLAGRWLDLVPVDLWPGFARLSSRDTAEIDRMLRLSADITDLFVLSLDTHPGAHPAANTPAKLARARWLTLFGWLFAPQRAYAGATFASALATRLSKATSREMSPVLASRIREQTGIDIAVPSANSSDLSQTPTRVIHAGAVLLWPFLSRLWEVFDLMEAYWEDGHRRSRFVSDAAVERAVLMLHYVVSGRTEAPEYDLVMHKLLCGLPSSVPVARHIEVTAQEDTIINDLLRSMIQHWSAIGSTSPEGLREAFLQRAGVLSLGENGWHLKVERTAFDVLLERLPWGISTVHLSWMPQPLWVQWV